MNVRLETELEAKLLVVLGGKSDTVPAKKKVAKCMVVGDSVLPSAAAEHVDRIVECIPGITTQQLPRVIGRRDLGSPKTSGMPKSQFRGICIRNNLIRIGVSLICKLSGTPD
jgi:hypothetical protein